MIVTYIFTRGPVGSAELAGAIVLVWMIGTVLGAGIGAIIGGIGGAAWGAGLASKRSSTETGG
jgi:hypothetical protein